MPTNDFKIGVIGGYVSGKATFLNALLKAPCFTMQSSKHNNALVEIKASRNNKLTWRYFNPRTKNWQTDSEILRESSKHKNLMVEVPFFRWGDVCFYDFPQINDPADWLNIYSDDISQMNYILCILDAEYALLAKNMEIIKTIFRSHNKNFSVVLNKCDIIDNIDDIKKRILDLYAQRNIFLSVFTISSQLELQRCLEPHKRAETFAFTKSREQVMTLCDLSFSDLRTMLYETVNISKI